MSEAFDLYKAPQFIDFKNEEQFNNSADSYFDVDHENFRSPNADETLRPGEKTNFLSPTGEFFQDYSPDKDPLSNSSEGSNLRKSMSIGNLVLFSEQTLRNVESENHNGHSNVEELCEKTGLLTIKNDPQESKKPVKNGHIRDSCNKPNYADNSLKKTGPVRTSASKLYRPMSKENLNRLAQPKRYNSVENLQAKSRFISMAESIIQFQNKTPTRFRSKPDLITSQPKVQKSLQPTVPQSPALLTKLIAKHRFRETIPSYEERVQMEFEKEQKFKIKAHPVNKKILSGPLKPMVPVAKKPATIAEPFHLTEVVPKKPPTPKKFEFHAQPMPNFSVDQHKKTDTKKRITEAVTPSFMKHYKKEMVKKHQEEATNNEKNTEKPLQPTKVKPFSFEDRDRQVQMKKDQLVKKLVEEEKRARQFHAKPVPKFILKRSESSRNNSVSSCNSSRRKSQDNLLQPNFKARPAVVLHKEPFVPQKPDKPCTEIQPFDLSTEHRAIEREEFEMQKRAREAKLEIQRKIQELKEKEKEKEEIARLRKEAEVKAQPVRKYKEVLVVPANKVTMPISPKFETDRLRKEKKMANKENMSNNISS